MLQCASCFHKSNEIFSVCPKCGYFEGKQENPIYRLPIGTIIYNRYVIGGVLGSGGFGITYRAWDMKLEAVVALKELYVLGIVNRVPGTKDITIVSKKRANEYKRHYMRFLEEARNMAKFNGDPNIVNVFEYFEENNTAYIVMEFMDGQDLRGFLKNFDGKLDVETSVQIIVEVCKALTKIHKEGIIHRDISPDNIMICANNYIKLFDFGAAKFLEGLDEIEIVLKPGFAPPEQYEKINKQGPWTDLYALGATMYVMVTGIKPEESTNRKTKDELPPPHIIDPSIPENISNAIMKAMAVDVHMRFSSVDEFQKAIEGKKKVISVEKEKKNKKKKRLIGILSAVVILTVAFLVFRFNWNKQKEEETLPEATIELWYVMDDSKENIAKEEALKAIVDEFMRSYDTVTVELVGIPSDEYEDKLLEAKDDDNLPEIFESTDLSGKYLEDTVKVNDVVNNVSDSIWFSKQLKKIAKSDNKLSTGFYMPFVYVNTIMYTEDTDDLDDVLDDLGIDDIEDEDSLKSFLVGETEVLYGDNSYYNEVLDVAENKHTISYKVLKLDDELSCKYGNMWSINNCSEDEMKVAKKLLEFFFSDNAQLEFYIKNETAELFPMNKAALSMYEDVHKNLYESFFEEIDDYDIE